MFRRDTVTETKDMTKEEKELFPNRQAGSGVWGGWDEGGIWVFP